MPEFRCENVGGTALGFGSDPKLSTLNSQPLELRVER
jgi:hypothetical protein